MNQTKCNHSPRRLEHHHQPLLPWRAFLGRLARSGAMAAAVIIVSLAIGTLGYHHIEGLAWIDALLNASMILSGMGMISELHTTGGKLFASAYALFSGIVFLTIAAILFTPLLHRLMHHFHLDQQSPEKPPRTQPPK